ncbi:hypothetical protein [Comamonas thiooxydans]|uniref:hypothetical protein n=1 Tax=Comamonas thiooxydans TaxID=363952 RepID=UPI000B40E381|nr:hypothetical protein [Comamonas thiooxydans]
MNKVSQIIQRTDGSQVKIVAEVMFGLGLTRSVDVFLLKRPNADAKWASVSKLPHPDWRSMSVDEYKRRGRSEMLQLVTHGEIFKVTNQLALGQ